MIKINYLWFRDFINEVPSDIKTEIKAIMPKHYDERRTSFYHDSGKKFKYMKSDLKDRIMMLEDYFEMEYKVGYILSKIRLYTNKRRQPFTLIETDNPFEYAFHSHFFDDGLRYTSCETINPLVHGLEMPLGGDGNDIYIGNCYKRERNIEYFTYMRDFVIYKNSLEAILTKDGKANRIVLYHPSSKTKADFQALSSTKDVDTTILQKYLRFPRY